MLSPADSEQKSVETMGEVETGTSSAPMLVNHENGRSQVVTGKWPAG